MTEPVFRGVGVALLTFFDDDGRLDATGTAAFADRLVERGIEAIVVAGTTGEASKLERSERTDLLDAVVDVVRGRVPVVAGTGAATADAAETLTTDAVAHGAD
ncbi:MAG TPA: dihydrodipicolinate synthase family protein, partial [Acidimicrobiia bacterium]|nr:dihydrodipicolinate synthase family protein [Acidimicrobiia bacterium]